MSSKRKNQIGVDSATDLSQESKEKEPSFDDIGKSQEASAMGEAESSAGWGSVRVFVVALLSFVMLWFSFPPFGIWWLAWIAPAPMVWLVVSEKLPGRRPYWQLYFAGMVYWLATFYFVPIPHIALWLAWIVLGIYLAVYIPLLIGIARTLVHVLKLPTIICVPVVWTGLEWIRGHIATGHSFACLSHTQYQQPMLIQSADIFGAYTVTFVIVWVSAGVAMLGLAIARLLIGESYGTQKRSIIQIAFTALLAALMLCATCFYGNARLEEPTQYRSDSVAKIALIQTSEDVQLKRLTDEQKRVIQYNKRKLTHQAREQWDDLDLIVWPESAFLPFVDLIADLDAEITVEAVANVRTQVWSDVTGYPNKFATPVSLFTGGQTQDPEKDETYNSAFLIGSDGKISERYLKQHLVMVGEYIPLSDQLPWLEDISPGSSINAGKEFTSFVIKGVNFAPNICFESTVPHFVLRQLNTLAKQGTETDVMINVTNDGWFFGTSCLDLHLACNVMRAVELRRPNLVASNTGFSAHIDSCGRILEPRSPRRAEAVLLAEIRPIERSSFYRQTGELIPSTFGYICIFGALVGFVKRYFPSGTSG